VAHEDGRRRLGAALKALEASGRARLPGRLQDWDRGPKPWLPRHVSRVRAPRPAREPVTIPDAVYAVLPPDNAARLAALRPGPSDVAVLAGVAGWLAAGGAQRPVVPSRERSLQVFGDEKRLDGLVRGRLFAAGVLSLGLLRAEVVPVPLRATWVPGRRAGRPRCLIAENHHTWASLLRRAWATADAHAGIHVGWGAGNQFPQGVAGVGLLEPPVAAVAYFGDLDANGLAIPAAADVAARPAGLPPVRPALGLYHLLLQVCGRQQRAAALDAATAAERAAWLGPLAAAAAELLLDGVRLPQESVGTEVLADTIPSDWF
jgi:hypothetical protein